MFRVGKLQHCVALVATKGLYSSLHLQRRCIQSWGYLQQAMCSPSATAQILGGGGKPKQPSQPQTVTKIAPSWPRKIFSGIQPTGSLHLGNYLGAIRPWVELQNAQDEVTVCIVDMHSITMPHNPPLLRENIFLVAATLLACGIDPAKSTLFVQSAVPEHAEFNWILSSLTAMPRLAQLSQYREKSRVLKDITLGLYVYPVLQAADIMLYKATHVPVGADQLQHIQLAQHLARTYNGRYGETFPVCQTIIDSGETSRVLSLQDPTKKMSKTDCNYRAMINLTDSPDQIAQKIKNAVTDFTSDISYNPGKRPGISNLVNIHSQVTGQTIKSVVDEASTLDTAKYKERVSEAVIEHLRPIREEIQQYLSRRNDVIYYLEVGADRARQQAQHTLSDVKERLGLGTSGDVPAAVQVASLLTPEVSKTSASRLMSSDYEANAHERHKRMYGFGDSPSGEAEESATGEQPLEMGQPMVRRMVRRPPVVPSQSLRVEKQLGSTRSRHVFQMDNKNAPHIVFKSPPKFPSSMGKEKIQTPKLGSESLGYGHDQKVIPSAVSMIAREVNAPKKQEFTCNLANSGFYSAAKDCKAIVIAHDPKEERPQEPEEERAWENADQSAPEQTIV